MTVTVVVTCGSTRQKPLTSLAVVVADTFETVGMTLLNGVCLPLASPPRCLQLPSLALAPPEECPVLRYTIVRYGILLLPSAVTKNTTRTQLGQ